MPGNPNVLPIAIITLVLSACANSSYYQRHYDFNKEFEQGDLAKALETLKSNDQLAKSKSKFIYYANNGLLLSIMGKYEESNEYFEKAFLFGEDYRINYANEAISYWTNPNVTIYKGEDHEHLIVLYYKAINYLKMGKQEEALVECRRLNIRLQQLSDKYMSDKKYQRDAFVHTLMGIIYQSSKDYNNAFIAYRNALEVYEDDYARLFNVQVPEQLKRDLLNTASWTGFTDEFENFKTQFGLVDYVAPSPESDLIFFWHNGLGPVKDEWSINFVIRHESNNMVVFYNDLLGLRFPFQVDSDQQRSDLSKLEVFRIAFPRYVERPLYFRSAKITADTTTYSLELAEDINKIAFHSLRERMVLEFSKGLLRAALKKATEHSIRKEDEALGALIGVMNAITEHADTRNWQTLPYAISYARIPLKEGANSIDFDLSAPSGRETHYQFNYQVAKGQTLFHTFSSLESLGSPGRFD